MNDDYNHRLDIETALVQVCGMSESDAQASTIVAHETGYCPIFEGDTEDAKKLQEKLEDLGVNTQITEVNSEPL
jgi:ATP-dependent Clp protease adapter protein ClpS